MRVTAICDCAYMHAYRNVQMIKCVYVCVVTVHYITILDVTLRYAIQHYATLPYVALCTAFMMKDIVPVQRRVRSSMEQPYTTQPTQLTQCDMQYGVQHTTQCIIHRKQTASEQNNPESHRRTHVTDACLF